MIDDIQIYLGKIALRMFPDLYRRRGRHWARHRLPHGPALLLSFDCDTNRDAKAAIKIQTQLNNASIQAGYAIPGELLEAHWEDYRKLLPLGGYLINHGFRTHADINENTGKPYSTFTYREVEKAVWQQDILRGHNTILNLTGAAPVIFRTPHFGEFNKPHQLRQLYRFLASLGYKVSSSTTPVFGFLHGGVHKCYKGIIEVPLSGTLSKPTQLIDSWGFVSSPDALGRTALISALENYLRLFSAGNKMFANIYFDPADIAEDKEILDLLLHFKPFCYFRYDNPSLLNSA